MNNLSILVTIIELLKSAENSSNTVFCPPIKTDQIGTRIGERYWIGERYTFLHLFSRNRKNSNARILHLDAFDREFNSIPFHSARIFKLGFVCAKIDN